MVERARLAEPDCTYTAPPRWARQLEMMESVTMRSVSLVYVAPPLCAVAKRERGEAAPWTSLSLAPLLCGAAGEAVSSTRRTSPAEQPDTVEPISETAPL